MAPFTEDQGAPLVLGPRHLGIFDGGRSANVCASNALLVWVLRGTARTDIWVQYYASQDCTSAVPTLDAELAVRQYLDETVEVMSDRIQQLLMTHDPGMRFTVLRRLVQVLVQLARDRAARLHLLLAVLARWLPQPTDLAGHCTQTAADEVARQARELIIGTVDAMHTDPESTSSAQPMDFDWACAGLPNLSPLGIFIMSFLENGAFDLQEDDEASQPVLQLPWGSAREATNIGGAGVPVASDTAGVPEMTTFVVGGGATASTNAVTTPPTTKPTASTSPPTTRATAVDRDDEKPRVDDKKHEGSKGKQSGKDGATKTGSRATTASANTAPTPPATGPSASASPPTTRSAALGRDEGEQRVDDTKPGGQANKHDGKDGMAKATGSRATPKKGDPNLRRRKGADLRGMRGRRRP